MRVKNQRQTQPARQMKASGCSPSASEASCSEIQSNALATCRVRKRWSPTASVGQELYTRRIVWLGRSTWGRFSSSVPSVTSASSVFPPPSGPSVLLKGPFTRVEHSVPNISYFKSAGVREIQFPGIVTASLQLGKSAKSPQISTPVPGWKICGDSEHFHPSRKLRATKMHHSRQHPTVPRQAKNRKKCEP